MEKSFLSFLLLVLLLVTVPVEKCGGDSSESKSEDSSEGKSDDSSKSKSEGSAENDKSKENSQEKINVQDLRFNIITSSKYYIARNTAAQTFVLLDTENGFSYMSNGKTGEVFVFRYETGAIAYIPKGSSDKTWLSSKQGLDEYLKSAGSPKDLFTIGQTQGVTFQIDTVGKEYIHKARRILTTVSPYYGSRCDVIGIFMYISRMTSIGLKGPLAGFDKVVGGVTTNMHGDLKWLFGIFQGMGNFFTGFKGLNALIEKNVHLDLKIIFTRKTGIHVLIYFLETLSKQFDLKVLLKNTLEVQEQLFSLIDQLSGQVNHGCGGLVHILAEILKFNGKNSIQNIHIALKLYFKHVKATANKEISEQWISSVRDLQETLKKVNLEQGFPKLTKLLNEIINEKWSYNGINMSQVIKKILSVERQNDDESIKSILSLLKQKNSKD